MSDVTDRTFRFATGLGVVLVVLGVASYVITDFASVTALIPAFFGLAIAVLGLVGRDNDQRRRAAYLLVGLGALAVVGSLRVVPDLLALIGGDEVDSLVATASQTLMIVLGSVLVAAVAVDLFGDR